MRTASCAPFPEDRLDCLSNSGRLPNRVKHNGFATFSRKMETRIRPDPRKCPRLPLERQNTLRDQSWSTEAASGIPSRMVFGHNLRYMAPFDFSRAMFCMVFRRASFVFSCLGTDFGGPGRILDPRGRHVGSRAFLLGPEKYIFAEE